jgi:hypothetical protein
LAQAVSQVFFRLSLQNNEAMWLRLSIQFLLILCYTVQLGLGIVMPRSLQALSSASFSTAAPPQSDIDDIAISYAVGRDTYLDVISTEEALKLFRSGNFITAANIDDIAISYVAGRDTYIDVISKYILNQTSKGHITRLPGKTHNNFVVALYESIELFPNSTWYYVCDDDNFVDVKRLADFASGYDPSQNHFIGNHHGVRGRPCAEPLNWQSNTGLVLTGCDGPGWICGGPGVLISRPLALAMKQRNCANTYRPEDNGDINFALCAMDAWGNGYSPEHSSRFVFNHGEAQGDAIAVHRISPDTFAALGRSTI